MLQNKRWCQEGADWGGGGGEEELRSLISDFPTFNCLSDPVAAAEVLLGLEQQHQIMERAEKKKK